MNNNTRLTVTENILMLERGRDELLLANYLNLRPLYIKKGRKYIKNFLKASSELGTYNKIIEAFPYEASLLEILIDHGIVVFCDSPPKNTNLPKSSEELNFNSRSSISLYLLISQSCNMGCIYCLNGTKTYQKDKALMMSKETAFKSIERCLDSTSSQGHLEIIFFGGEPLLNWPLAKEIIIYCENSLKEKHTGKQIKYHVTSNLSFLPTDLIEWAKKYNFTFLCNIDGPGEIHNICRPFKDGKQSHETIIKNIKHLVDAGFRVDLRATVTALNQDYLMEITEHHKEIGGSSSAFLPVNPVNSDEDILPERLLPSPQNMISGMINIYRSKLWKDEELHPFNMYAARLASGAMTVLGCGMPCGNTVVVDVNGNVYPCIYLVGIKRFYMGNVMNESYPDRKLLDWMYNYLHVDHMDDCKSCSWRYICGGGCPLGRLTVLNNPAASEKVATYCKRITCEYTKKILELLLWEKAQETASNLLKKHGVHEATGISDKILC